MSDIFSIQNSEEADGGGHYVKICQQDATALKPKTRKSVIPAIMTGTMLVDIFHFAFIIYLLFSFIYLLKK